MLGCTHYAPRLDAPLTPGYQGEEEFLGWLSHVGEFRLFDSAESLRDRATSPRCISGVTRSAARIDLAQYNNKNVRVRGVLVRYSDLAMENRPILPRRALNGRLVHNFCLGDSIILATSISIVR